MSLFLVLAADSSGREREIRIVAADWTAAFRAAFAWDRRVVRQGEGAPAERISVQPYAFCVEHEDCRTHRALGRACSEERVRQLGMAEAEYLWERPRSAIAPQGP